MEQEGITKWGKKGLQSGAAFWITKWGKLITKWGRDYIVGQYKRKDFKRFSNVFKRFLKGNKEFKGFSRVFKAI